MVDPREGMRVSVEEGYRLFVVKSRVTSYG